MRALIAMASVGLVVVLALALSGEGLDPAIEAPAVGAPHVVGLRPRQDPAAIPSGLSTVSGEGRDALLTEGHQAPGTVALIVTDANTGQQLAKGSVLRRAQDAERSVSDARATWRSPPRAFSQVVVRDDDFPEVLDNQGDDPIVWIGARGYAWTSTRLSASATSAHVALVPAGSLTLRFATDLLPAPASDSEQGEPLIEVELRHEGHQLISPTERGLAFEATPGDVQHLDQIPVGTYELVARVDSPLGVGHVLARQHIAVAQGESASVLVTPSAQAEPPTLTVFLQLDVAGADQDDLLRQSVRLFRRADDGTLDIVGFDASPRWTEVAPAEVWEVSYHQLEAGTYQVFLDPSAVSQEVTLVAGTESTVLFELTDLATVTLDIKACTTDGRQAGLIWGYQANHRRLREYIRLQPGRSVVQIECVAKPIWVQVVGAGMGSEPVSLHPLPSADLAWTIGCSSGFAASAHVAVLPGAHSPSPDSSEFWNRVHFQQLGGDGIMHAFLPWASDRASEEYEQGAYVGTLLFDRPGEYEMAFDVQWGVPARAYIVAGADPTPVTLLQLE